MRVLYKRFDKEEVAEINRGYYDTLSDSLYLDGVGFTIVVSCNKDTAYLLTDALYRCGMADMTAHYAYVEIKE